MGRYYDISGTFTFPEGQFADEFTLKMSDYGYKNSDSEFHVKYAPDGSHLDSYSVIKGMRDAGFASHKLDTDYYCTEKLGVGESLPFAKEESVNYLFGPYNYACPFEYYSFYDSKTWFRYNNGNIEASSDDSNYYVIKTGKIGMYILVFSGGGGGAAGYCPAIGNSSGGDGGRSSCGYLLWINMEKTKKFVCIPGSGGSGGSGNGSAGGAGGRTYLYAEGKSQNPDDYQYGFASAPPKGGKAHGDSTISAGEWNDWSVGNGIYGVIIANLYPNDGFQVDPQPNTTFYGRYKTSYLERGYDGYKQTAGNSSGDPQSPSICSYRALGSSDGLSGLGYGGCGGDANWPNYWTGGSGGPGGLVVLEG